MTYYALQGISIVGVALIIVVCLLEGFISGISIISMLLKISIAIEVTSSQYGSTGLPLLYDARQIRFS